MAELDYLLTFANIPFVSDRAKVFRLPSVTSHEFSPEQLSPARKQQPEDDLIDELNRLIPFHQLSDFAPMDDFPGRNIEALAHRSQIRRTPVPEVKIGEWFYPHSASRWSVFRGLATSSMVKAMLEVTKGRSAASFVMKNVPIRPKNTSSNLDTSYTITTSMYMLPPRPLAEFGGGQFDGLYLVTLVDERYYWQFKSVSLSITSNTTWRDVLTELSTALEFQINFPVTLPVYTQPEPDSQLWCSEENAAAIFDAVAYNLGSMVVRNYQGLYNLLQPIASRTQAYNNRNSILPVTRTAGGDIFQSGGRLPAGNLISPENSILPTHVQVNFPKYVLGNDPVPHFVNPRYQNPRPSAWYEQSYGDVYTVSVPLLSGGLQFSGQLGVYISGSLQIINGNPTVSSGLTGTAGYIPTIHDTAKALYSGDADLGLSPLNTSGLTSLAMQLAYDYFNQQIAVALDEVYPGTFAWEPDGIHDIIWTYSEKRRQASTRVMKSEWNTVVSDMQHATPPVSGQTNAPVGVGGLSVAQSWRDSTSGTISTTLTQTLSTSGLTASFADVSYFPTQNRWRGRIDDEVILFEGTSGGTAVDVVYRGIDGTLPVAHNNGRTVTQVLPNTTYGVNLLTTEKMGFVYPSDWTSGGVQGANIVPQTQTVKVLASGRISVGGIPCYSGQIAIWQATGGYTNGELVWVADRNGQPLQYNRYYDGQFVGHSDQTPRAAPLYLTNESLINITFTSGFPITSGIPISGTTSCSTLYLPYSEQFCINGTAQIWQRYFYLGMNQACPTLQAGPWNFLRYAGCCLCDYWWCHGEPDNPSCSQSSTVPTDYLKGPYFNQADCEGECECTPGTCSVCDDPPYRYVVSVFSFGGLCDVFNGVWNLDPAGACTWQADPCLSTQYTSCVEVELTIDSGEAVLTFTKGNVSVVYTASQPEGDCCQPLIFSPADPDDCSCENGVEATTCPSCDEAPTTWQVFLVGATNCYATFNGDWTLTSSGLCRWSTTQGNVTVVLSIDAAGRVNLSVSDSVTGGTALYSSLDPVRDRQCCQRFVLANISTSCSGGTGAVPQLIEVHPSCNEAPDNQNGSCAPSIIVQPYCCEDSEDDDQRCAPCDLCPFEITPWAWYFDEDEFVGDCSSFNGHFEARQTGDPCVWSNVSGLTTVSMTVEIVEVDGVAVLRLTLQVFVGGELVSVIYEGNPSCCVGGEVLHLLNWVSGSCAGVPNTIDLYPRCCLCTGEDCDDWCIENEDGTRECVTTATMPPEAIGTCDSCYRWWCDDLSGTLTCVFALNASINTVSGPYDSQEECEAVCIQSCCESPAPDNTLRAVLTNVSDCSCVDGAEDDITDPGDGIWTNTVGLCSEQPITVDFRCNEEENYYEVRVRIVGAECTSDTGWVGPPDDQVCDPFEVTFSSVAISAAPDPSCCGPTSPALINITITDPP